MREDISNGRNDRMCVGNSSKTSLRMADVMRGGMNVMMGGIRAV